MISKKRGRNNFGTPVHLQWYGKTENDFYEEIDIKKDSKQDEDKVHKVLKTDKIKRD